MSKIVLYHGSQKIVEKPLFGAGKLTNDYGQGFYCTEHLELAKEWACGEFSDGFASRYQIETDGLSILNLHDDAYNTLHWLALLVSNRTFDVSTPLARQAFDFLKSEYLLNLTSYDLVYGYRADDSYFAFARLFLSNQISYSQLQRAMKLGKLGNQYVLKSQKAFDSIEFTGFETAEAKIWYAQKINRMEKARMDFQKMTLMESVSESDIFIRDLILGKVDKNDPRLR